MVIRRGFTLIELLIVVVIIGILAGVAIPKFSDTKGKAYASGLKSDLRNLAGQQEGYFHSFETYSTSLSEVGMAATSGSVLTIVEASPGGWSATATHPQSDPLICAVFYGTAAPVAPATTEGVVTCE